MMLRSMVGMVSGLAALAIAGSSAFAQSNPDWDKIVAAAKAEGVVTLYTGLPGNPSTKKLADAFQKKYGIRMDVLELRASELRERIRTEYAAGRTLGDVTNTAPNQMRTFLNDGTVENYGPLPNFARLSPQVKATWEKQTPEVQLPIFNLYYGLLVNTRLVPDPPKTYADLADPRFKGKILADDFRAVGGGHTFHSAPTWRSGRPIMRNSPPTG